MPSRGQAVLFRDLTIQPTLATLALPGAAWAELLLGTAIQESRLMWRRQWHGGPARGLFQMEPDTHDDIWSNYLKYHHALAAQVASLMSSANAEKHKELEANDKYACAMACVHFSRKGHGALPRSGDVSGMAKYWKKHYNTLLGAGTVEEYESNWQKVMG